MRISDWSSDVCSSDLVVDLPRGATPLDFAYHVHTDVDHRCRGAKVDGRIVPLDHRLQSGARVEILTGKVSEPRRDWLVAANGFLASARSREQVRTWRSEEHTSELPSPMRHSYAAICL